jgi:hypothetical protein
VIFDLFRSLGEEEMTILLFFEEGNKNRCMGKRGMFDHSSFS